MKVTFDAKKEIIFGYSASPSAEIAHRTSSLWYQFSSFVPAFFDCLLRYIEEPTIRERISHIIFEELGEGSVEANHANLFRLAVNRAGGVLDENYMAVAVKNFSTATMKSIQDSNDSEAFAVGLAYGLEIIAEENIFFLLKYSSQNDQSLESLKRSAFFIIHLQNETEHIRKCEENFEILKRKRNCEQEFLIGVDMSLTFWKEFWREAIA